MGLQPLGLPGAVQDNGLGLGPPSLGAFSEIDPRGQMTGFGPAAASPHQAVMSGVELSSQDSSNAQAQGGTSGTKRQALVSDEAYDAMAAEVRGFLGMPPVGSPGTEGEDGYQKDDIKDVLMENYLTVIDEDYPVICKCDDLGKCNMDQRIRRCVDWTDFASPLSVLTVALVFFW